MHQRNTLGLAWLALILALIAMIIGHLGDHDFSWLRNQISTFAARAPYDDWITASMLLSALALLSISLLISRHRILGDDHLTHVVPIIAGIAISGLLMLAYYEETQMTLASLMASGFDSIRRQSFHDAGLLLFFYGSIAVMMLLGTLAIIHQKHWRGKFIGVSIAACGPMAFLFMATAWPKLMGIAGTSTGLKQRVAFLSIWLGAVLLLALIRRNMTKIEPGV